MYTSSMPIFAHVIVLSRDSLDISGTNRPRVFPTMAHSRPASAKCGRRRSGYYFPCVGSMLIWKFAYWMLEGEYMSGEVNPPDIIMFPTNDGEMINITLSTLNPNKARGFDNIKPSIVQLIHIIAIPLTSTDASLSTRCCSWSRDKIITSLDN